MKKVAVIMGSDSDWPVVKGACAQLQEFGIPYEAHILSAHRTPAAAAEFARGARQNGFGVLICAAAWPPTWRSLRRQLHSARHRHPHEGGRHGRPGRPAGHRPDAQRHPRGHRGHQRGQERRRAGRPDPGGLDDALAAKLDEARRRWPSRSPRKRPSSRRSSDSDRR